MSARKRCDVGECGRMDWERRIAELEALLRTAVLYDKMPADWMDKARTALRKPERK